MKDHHLRQLVVLATASFWVAVGLTCCAAKAEEVTVGLHVASHHFPERSYQNNVNPGVYVRTADGWTGGIYYNTLRRTSIYAGYTWEAGPFALTAGMVSGYQLKNGYGVSNAVLTPFISPSVALPRVLGVTPRLSIIPGTRATSNVLHLSIETNL